MPKHVSALIHRVAVAIILFVSHALIATAEERPMLQGGGPVVDCRIDLDRAKAMARSSFILSTKVATQKAHDLIDQAELCSKTKIRRLTTQNEGSSTHYIKRRFVDFTT